MAWDALDETTRAHVRKIVGYLHFSTGKSDPSFLEALSEVFAAIDKSDGERPLWKEAHDLLRESLDRLENTSDAFSDLTQARQVLLLVFEHLLPAYRQFHRDLLYHQTDDVLYQPFFLGRAVEAVLAEGPPWDETDRVVRGALVRLNDFIGHRPVAVLEDGRKCEPYAHERVRPIPLYIEGAGVASGPYQELVTTALDILRDADSDLLEDAWFDLGRLEELAVDPRSYDFDHPVNRRPNYHFGGWDPDHIDNKGFYRRFVLQQVTLDAILERTTGEPGGLPLEEALYEGGAVLAGTMLMGSGITGDRPEAHSSDTSLETLLPHIAAYRDRFYQMLLDRAPPQRRERLEQEEACFQQPFGGVRQDLNQLLARYRAEQMQRVHLARLFARMGYPDAALEQIDKVSIASARMRCDIDCQITRAHRAIDRGDLDAAARCIGEVEATLHRAIECGALVDPWNILGFDANYSLFPALENSVHDHRVDELIDLMNDIFGFYARLEKEAAAAGQGNLQAEMSDRLYALADWWDKYASTEVSSVEGFSGQAAWESTAQVATALRAWHGAESAAGNVGFWAQHVDRFTSPKAYALSVEALLEQGDAIASMALMMHWLSQSDEIHLAEGDYSFHGLAVRWMEELWLEEEKKGSGLPGRAPKTRQSLSFEERWSMTRKFLDFLEANAGGYWETPRFELETDGYSDEDDGDDEDWEDEDEDESLPDGGFDSLFDAAYDNVVYRDTTDDGFDAEMVEGGHSDDEFEISAEAERISDRLAFLVTLAKLWKVAAAHVAPAPADEREEDIDTRRAWLDRATLNCNELLRLLDAVHRYRIPTPRGTPEALMEYDQHRGIQEILLERVIVTAVETFDAVQFLQATLKDLPGGTELASWEMPARHVFRAIFQDQRAEVQRLWPALLKAFASETLLYVPTSRGGSARRIVASRCLQQVLARLLAYTPRLGLLAETYQLLLTIHRMEKDHPVGPGAITEYDRLFEIGCRGIAQCIISSSESWEVAVRPGKSHRRSADLELIACLEQATERLLQAWLAHSRGIRISPLESAIQPETWDELKRFITTFGGDIFSQHFMYFNNLRAILHEGVENYLESLDDDTETALTLREAISAGAYSPEEAIDHLEVILETIAEHYSEYIDYNSTTTQSDRGEMLYTLLDFLRLQTSYDRVAWNLSPVYLVHETLVREDREKAAGMWERAAARRTADVATHHLRQYDRLSRQYGMWLPSIQEHLQERFVRPMETTRLSALVRPSIEDADSETESDAFRRLCEQVDQLMREPSRAGFEIPSWLEAIEEETHRVLAQPLEVEEAVEPSPSFAPCQLSLEEIRHDMVNWQPPFV